MYNYTLDECGPLHITVGDGGNHEKASLPHADEPGQCPKDPEAGGDSIGGYCGFPFSSGPAAGKYCWDRQPEWSAFREASFGHGIIKVSISFPEWSNDQRMDRLHPSMKRAGKFRCIDYTLVTHFLLLPFD